MVDETQKYPEIINPNAEQKDSTAFSAGAKMQTKPVGSSGTEVYAGYFAEEYLQSLRGKLGAKVWDEMRRSETQVAMLLAAMLNPIKSAQWDIEPFDQSENSKKQADLIKICLKEQIDWDTFLHEALTCIPFGFSLFEVVHNVVFNNPRLGTFNGLAAIAFRSQKTIEAWNLEKQTGKLLSVDQYTYGDVGDSVRIPGDFLFVITVSKEGDNYEGISVLRPMFGAWSRKNLYLKLTAIGIEKYAIGTPVGTIPSGKEDTDEVAAFKAVLSAFTSHESAYITKPQGWDIEIFKTDFDASKIKEVILLENTEMINAVVANFLALGMNGSGGAFALGTDLSDFFLAGIQAYANLISSALNRKLIPNLIKLNYGEQVGYPTIKCTGINDKAGKEFAEIFKMLVESKAIKPDAPLEDFLRNAYNMPKADPTTAREVAQPATEMQFSESIKLDEKYRKNFNKQKDNTKELMQKHLREMYQGLRKQIENKYNAASDADKIKVALNVVAPGVNAYREELKAEIAKVAWDAIQSARKAVPSKKNIKLIERVDSVKLADNFGYYDALPAAVKKLVLTQAELLATTQASDIEKTVLFQYATSAGAELPLPEILNDMDERIDGLLSSGVGAGMNLEAAAANVISQAYNQARLEFFFEPEVLEEIESFTFVNEDPVSDICKELNGTTFDVGDPDLSKFQPPLHHNCKSRYVPNLKAVKGNPEIDRGVTVSKKAMDAMTLCEHDVREQYRIT